MAIQNLCEVSLLLLNSDAEPTADLEVVFNHENCDDSPDTVTSDAAGAGTVFLPYGARIRCTSEDVSGIDGHIFTVPNTPSFNLGNFQHEPEA